MNYFEYKAEQPPQLEEDTFPYENKRTNYYEVNIKPLLPVIALLKSKGRSNDQIATALDINRNTFAKILREKDDLRDALSWGRETIGDKLEIQGYKMAMDGDKNYKYWEKMIEKNNPAYSKDQSDLIAQLGFDKLEININDMSKETSELEYVKEYEEKIKQIEKK